MVDQNNRVNIQILGKHSSLGSYVAFLVVTWFWTYACKIKKDQRTITHDIWLERDQVINELLGYLFSTELCRNILRMNPSPFTGLWEMLIIELDLRPTLWVTIEEKVAKTLYLLAHNVTNYELSFIFLRYGESISFVRISLVLSELSSLSFRGFINRY